MLHSPAWKDYYSWHPQSVFPIIPIHAASLTAAKAQAWVSSRARVQQVISPDWWTRSCRHFPIDLGACAECHCAATIPANQRRRGAIRTHRASGLGHATVIACQLGVAKGSNAPSTPVSGALSSYQNPR